MCKMNWKIRIFRNLARKKLFFLHFLTKQSNWSELPRKWKMDNFEVFLKNKWLKCPKPNISWYRSIVGITIKRLVHIACLQIKPSSQNLSSKLKSGPNYPVWRYLNFKDSSKHFWEPNSLQCNWKVKTKVKIAKWSEKQNPIKTMMRKTAGVDKYLWPKFDAILNFPFIQFFVSLSFFFFNILKRFLSADFRGI
jgi:hypothetical protein